MAKGYIDVLIETIPHFIAALPYSYSLVGSDKSEYEGYIRLVLESVYLSDEHDGAALAMMVSDIAGTRSMTIAPRNTRAVQHVEFTGMAG